MFYGVVFVSEFGYEQRRPGCIHGPAGRLNLNPVGPIVGYTD